MQLQGLGLGVPEIGVRVPEVPDEARRARFERGARRLARERFQDRQHLVPPTQIHGPIGRLPLARLVALLLRAPVRRRGLGAEPRPRRAVGRRAGRPRHGRLVPRGRRGEQVQGRPPREGHGLGDVQRPAALAHGLGRVRRVQRRLGVREVRGEAGRRRDRRERRRRRPRRALHPVAALGHHAQARALAPEPVVEVVPAPAAQHVHGVADVAAQGPQRRHEGRRRRRELRQRRVRRERAVVLEDQEPPPRPLVEAPQLRHVHGQEARVLGRAVPR
mmetsp:Transcript_16342/g.48774  ORF Transcript_16342/g.48774 Transcript_16342/m.48774 type:complete len:275 (+) Transcript_16342:348-1172(+)